MKTKSKVVLVLILIFAFSVNAFASTIGIQWEYINRVISVLNIDAYGVANATGTATTKNNDTISVVVNLQQFKSNQWITIKTWNGSGTKLCTVSGSYAVYSGYDYRTETIAKVYDDNGNKIEESEIYSPIKYY